MCVKPSKSHINKYIEVKGQLQIDLHMKIGQRRRRWLTCFREKRKIIAIHITRVNGLINDIEIERGPAQTETDRLKIADHIH